MFWEISGNLPQTLEFFHHDHNSWSKYSHIANQRGPKMDVFELSNKTTGHNIGGDKIDISVVGPQGVWSIEEAGRLIITKQVIFLYRGEPVTDLAILPEKA
jgi:hypothetical protein